MEVLKVGEDGKRRNYEWTVYNYSITVTHTYPIRSGRVA
jgi:hypothetical protein